jgi:ERF superfamily
MSQTIEMTMADISEVADTKPGAIQRAPQTAVVASATPSDLLIHAMNNGADLDRLERLMDLQTRWEAKEAKRAFDAAFAAFKSEAVMILKGRKVTDGPLKGKSYAELHDVVNAVTPALSKHGLSSSWKLTVDDKDWMQVTCYLRHVNGHEETVSMGGPPDAGGAKNAIQARASTKTYLERYTLKAITGLSEQEDDDDGRGTAQSSEVKAVVNNWVSKAKGAKTTVELKAVWQEGLRAMENTNDMSAYKEFKHAVESKGADFRAAQEEQK